MSTETQPHAASRAHRARGADPGIQPTANRTASQTLAFIIAADNFYGPIIDRRIPLAIPGTAAAMGFSAASTMGSTDSRANFAQ